MQTAHVRADSNRPPAVKLLQSVRCLKPPELNNSSVAALCAELCSSFGSQDEVSALTEGSYKLAGMVQSYVFLNPESSESFRDICVMLECFLGDGGVAWAQVKYIVISWLLPGDQTTYFAQQFVITECYIKTILKRSPKLRLLLLPFGLVAGPASIGADPKINLPPTGLGNLDQLTRLLGLVYDKPDPSLIHEVLECLDHCFKPQRSLLESHGGESQAIAVVELLYDDLLSKAYDRPVVAGRGHFLESLLSSPNFPFATPIAVDVWKEELEIGLLDNLSRHQHLHSLYISLTGESLGSWTFTNLKELGITVELRNGISTLERFEFLARTVPDCPKLRTLRINRIAGSESSNLEKMNYLLAASFSTTLDSLLVDKTNACETGRMPALYRVYVDGYCAWQLVDGTNYGLPPSPAVTDSATLSVPPAHEGLNDRQ